MSRIENYRITRFFNPINTTDTGVEINFFNNPDHFLSPASEFDLNKSLPQDTNLRNINTKLTEPLSIYNGKAMIVFDTGNSKIEITAIDPVTLEKIYPDEIYLTQRYEYEKISDGTDLKMIDGNEFIDRMKEAFLRIIFESGINPENIDKIIGVGLGNGLAVSKKLPNGKYKHWIITNDELELKISEEQQKQIENTGGDVCKMPLMLKKLIILKNHPELLNKLFRENTEFTDLKFNSFLGFLKSEILGREFGKIPFDDKRRFTLESGITTVDITKILRALGISVLSFESGIDFQEEIIMLNDFTIERSTWEKLCQLGVLTNNICGISSDTKAKIIVRNTKSGLLPDGVVRVDGVIYDKSNFGSHYWSWLEAITANNQFLEVNEFQKKDVFEKTSMIIRNNIERTSSSKYIFYPNADSKGTLIDSETHKQIFLNEINDFSDQEKLEIGWAVTLGMLFALREKIENLPCDSTITKIYGYGGTFYRRIPWRELAAQVFPQQFYYFDMPSAVKAAVFLTQLNSGLIKEEVFIKYWSDPNKLKFIPNEYNISRNQEYQQWLNFKPKK